MKLLLKKKPDGFEMLGTTARLFNDIQKDVQSIQDKCTDYITSGSCFSDICLSTGKKQAAIKMEKEVIYRSFYKNAFCQLCSKVGVPVGYINSCIDRGNTWLAEKNILSWLNGRYCDTKFFIREHDGMLRGVLSPYYKCFDAPDILNAVSPYVSGMEMVGYLVSPERMHLRFISETPLIKDEDIYSGIEIDSSDTGRACVSIQYFVYKKVCTNGLMLPLSHCTFFSQRHISRDIKFNIEKKFSDNLRNLPYIEKQVRSMVEKSRNSLADLDKIKHMLVPGLGSETAVQGVVSLFERRVSGSTGFQYENNMYGVVNALTEYSQKYTLDRRIELEKYAGRVLMSAA